MACVSGTAISVSVPLAWRSPLASSRISVLNSVSFSSQRKSFLPIRLQQSRFNISCAAKPGTVDKVCEIVKKQLALPEGTAITGESKFAALGADSLDTVEIVMSIEEVFGISVEEENAQSISTVQDAADMVEKLVEAKSK